MNLVTLTVNKIAIISHNRGDDISVFLDSRLPVSDDKGSNILKIKADKGCGKAWCKEVFGAGIVPEVTTVDK